MARRVFFPPAAARRGEATTNRRTIMDNATAVRHDPARPEHDRQVELHARKLRDMLFTVHTNTGGNRSYGIVRGEAVYFPDIVVEEQDRVVRVYEVETENFTDREVHKWRLYAGGSSAFHLVVPRDRREDALSLSLANGIPACVHCF
jgi:hypothetical protein